MIRRRRRREARRGERGGGRPRRAGNAGKPLGVFGPRPDDSCPPGGQGGSVALCCSFAFQTLAKRNHAFDPSPDAGDAVMNRIVDLIGMPPEPDVPVVGPANQRPVGEDRESVDVRPAQLEAEGHGHFPRQRCVRGSTPLRSQALPFLLIHLRPPQSEHLLHRSLSHPARQAAVPVGFPVVRPAVVSVLRGILDGDDHPLRLLVRRVLHSVRPGGAPRRRGRRRRRRGDRFGRADENHRRRTLGLDLRQLPRFGEGHHGGRRSLTNIAPSFAGEDEFMSVGKSPPPQRLAQQLLTGGGYARDGEDGGLEFVGG
mmetsp:Transcript_48260/g.145874  ORF Transcript_48260/g.145874 Transcript_48260/m.145874 type:complete len:313 (-) Transcript_48260:106-1044(-)